MASESLEARAAQRVSIAPPLVTVPAAETPAAMADAAEIAVRIREFGLYYGSFRAIDRKSVV